MHGDGVKLCRRMQLVTASVDADSGNRNDALCDACGESFDAPSALSLHRRSVPPTAATATATATAAGSAIGAVSDAISCLLLTVCSHDTSSVLSLPPSPPASLPLSPEVHRSPCRSCCHHPFLSILPCLHSCLPHFPGTGSAPGCRATAVSAPFPWVWFLPKRKARGRRMRA